MIFTFGDFKLDIDVARTRRFYETVEDPLGCDCAGCRNFYAAYPSLPAPIDAFFQQLGVDLGSPAEMTAFVSHDGNLTLYDGFYHICGKILESPKLHIKTNGKGFLFNNDATIKLTPNHSVHFTNATGLVDDDFPRPVIQLQIMGDIPWVLDEPNPYYFQP